MTATFNGKVSPSLILQADTRSAYTWLSIGSLHSMAPTPRLVHICSVIEQMAALTRCRSLLSQHGTSAVDSAQLLEDLQASSTDHSGQSRTRSRV